MTMERELAHMVALAIKTATTPLLEKIAVLEARPVISVDALDGLKDITADLRARLLAVEARAALPGPAGPAGERGAVGPQGAMGPAGDRGERGERGEKGEPGLTVKGDRGETGPQGIKGEKGDPGVDGKDGAPGLSIKGDPGDRGERGERGADGAIGARGEQGDKGADGLHGKDGIGVMDAMIDREGNLILTLSNGQTKAVGAVVGKDGANGTDGQPGRDVDPLFVQDFLSKELAKWPRPKDGLDGKDGAPGLSPDDFDWDFNPETRELRIALSRSGSVLAERTKVLDGMRIHRGVYEAGRTYEKGDSVSWDGSEWTAMAQTKERPGNGSTPWKLTVKHGEKGPRGADGKPGRDGKDLTNMGPDGSKWGR